MRIEGARHYILKFTHTDTLVPPAGSCTGLAREAASALAM